MRRTVRPRNRVSPVGSHRRLVAAVVAVGVLGLTVFATACGDALEPEPEPPEPDPFPNAHNVRVWMTYTGLALSVGESFQQGFTVDEPSVSYNYYTYPPLSRYDSIPSAYRIAWWTSDTSVVSVGPTGVLTGRGNGSAVVWVQVESDRDSGAVRVGPSDRADHVRYSVVHAGMSHTCGLAETGQAYCWGADGTGRLGRGQVRFFTSAAAPGLVVGDARFVQLMLTGDHSCGLTAAGAARCWGYNRYGQLGNGEFDSATVAFVTGEPRPVGVVTAVAFDTLVTGVWSTCALDGEGAAYCWGWNVFGQLGIDTILDPFEGPDGRATPVPVSGGVRFRSLSRGGAHTCGVTLDGIAYCWGLNGCGQLGNEHVEPCQWPCSPRPVMVNTDLSFTQIAGGVEHTCALTANGRAYCWGSNGDGVLGSDSLEQSFTPVAVSTAVLFVALTSGSFHACGLTAAGEVYCWGANRSGQLGRGDRNFEPNPVPQLVSGGLRFTTVSCGAHHTCGLTENGDVYCWGAGKGALGNGKFDLFSAVPVKVIDPM